MLMIGSKLIQFFHVAVYLSIFSITGLTQPDSITRNLPSIAKFEIRVKANNPTCTIIHILDHHYVPKDPLIADIEDLAGRKLTAKEAKQQYALHLKEVDRVQKKQMKLLKVLIRKHGLKSVYLESLTKDSWHLFHAYVNFAKEVQKEQPIPQDSNEYLLKLGAAGRLLIKGENLEVLPLSDEKLALAAKPVKKDGKIVFNQRKMEAWEDGMVKLLIKRGGTVVIILGQGHDLADNVRRLGKWNCEYSRISP